MGEKEESGETRVESGETRDERGERRVERKETAWLMMDLGRERMIRQSELCFVRPTAGHAYVLEGSHDGRSWEVCGGHADVQKRSPHVDKPGRKYRYLRVTIKEGVCGVWEWRVI